MKQNKKMIVCFLTPALIFFVAAFLYPICRTVVMSLFKVESISDPVGLWEFVGLSNFADLAETTIFQVAMINMLKIWLIGGILVLSVALLFAGILTSGIVGKNVYRAIIYVPNIINAVAMSTMWINYVYNKRFGLLHNFFTWIGADGLAKLDYMNGSLKFVSLLIAFCFGSVGYFMLIFMSGIEQIPGDVFEAATIDGAGKIKQFFTITCPLLKGTFKTCLTFWTVSVVGFFVWSQMWSAPLASEMSTITPFIYMYNVTFGTMGNVERNGGLGAAVGVVMALVVLVVFFVVGRLVKDDDLEL
ncbi:carbohydrate ABC transporter permease [Blautia sp. Marseille-P3201T]|uniref:carbohydrate ABC transporter permease n=1 Tax=Blautia sp. Marseille-P3201T TaxID=1907659 RepID=UPI0009300CBB|nr:sugar ABC transporter permease [Blautia sp. Marseille-P3201T]